MRLTVPAALLLITCSVAEAQKPANAQSDTAVAEWAQEILLGSEFGGDGRVCSRWIKSPTLAVIGGTDDHYQLVADVVADLNDALAKTSVQKIQLKDRSSSSADIRVYFKPIGEFVGIANKERFRYVSGNFGYFYNKWNGKHEIYDGVVLLATDRLSGGQLRHYAFEEITQVLGLQNDSAAFPDSVFYAGSDGNGRAEKLSSLDQQLVSFFYTHASPGQNQQQLRSAIQKHWLKNATFERETKESIWAQTVLLGSEFGGSGKVCSRWTRSPTLSVFGGSAQHHKVIADTVAHINETLAATPIRRIQLLKPESKHANIRVDFAPLSDFPGLARKHRFNVTPGNLGYFYTFWNGRNEIQSAFVMLATDKLSGKKLQHYALEEITQSLGLSSDSPAFPDSIFFENGSNFGSATKLSTNDRTLVRIFYNHIKPGARRNDVREAIKTHWQHSTSPVSVTGDVLPKNLDDLATGIWIPLFDAPDDIRDGSDQAAPNPTQLWSKDRVTLASSEARWVGALERKRTGTRLILRGQVDLQVGSKVGIGLCDMRRKGGPEGKVNAMWDRTRVRLKCGKSYVASSTPQTKSAQSEPTSQDIALVWHDDRFGVYSNGQKVIEYSASKKSDFVFADVTETQPQLSVLAKDAETLAHFSNFRLMILD